ncbi:MAG TPA: hypothetical protein VHS31_15280 [Tepidisphaeraceae bacterium]|jgi:hypothetical protein|nr:hypothetical protein [Tepidisphaeraceae bacterium]
MRTALLILMCLVAGCQTAHVSEPLTQKLGGDDLDAQMEFWHQLEDRPVTCNDEAFHGFLLYLDQSDPNTDYAARVSALKARGFLPGDFNGQADEAVSRGTLAVAISHALQIKGGMMMHLAPSVPRYAVRELVYMELYPPSTPNQTFSGSEFVGIIGRIEDYQRGDNTDLPAAQLPH